MREEETDKKQRSKKQTRVEYRELVQYLSGIPAKINCLLPGKIPAGAQDF